jgi:ketosteroid isomerase-like protein
MKNLSCVLLLIFLSSSALFSQNAQQISELEINEQIWKPFKDSYETHNAEVFNGLHTDNMLRINAGGITLGPDYKANITARYNSDNQNKITIDFAHEHRFYNGDIGYEVGYYRVIYHIPDGRTSESYGRFHVVLKKIEGRWKITQDWDTEKVGSVHIDKSFFDGATFLKLD